MKDKEIMNREYANHCRDNPQERVVFNNFEAGFSANKKLTDKVILDTLNKYRSKQSNEQIPKLGKTANFEKEVHYKACIEVLYKLQNKLK